MNEMFLMKLGEVVLKGANKRQFENRLRHNVRRRMEPFGNFDVYILQSTVYIQPMDDQADLDGAWEACHNIFGVVSLCRCRPCEKNVDVIYDAVEAYLGDDLDMAESFKVESKRSDKAFPLTSIALSQEIGGRLGMKSPRRRQSRGSQKFLRRRKTYQNGRNNHLRGRPNPSRRRNRLQQRHSWKRMQQMQGTTFPRRRNLQWKK